MKTEMIAAGHGGQGVLELANCVSYYELLRGRRVACTPSYGPESRGGKVKCFVVVSDDAIDSPVVEEPDYLIVMNVPSMDYAGLLRSGGTLLMNSSLISDPPRRTDIQAIRIPATEMADAINEPELGEIHDKKIAANTVMFGAYLAITGEDLEMETMEAVFRRFFTDRKAAYVPLNLIAVRLGYEFAQSVRLEAR